MKKSKKSTNDSDSAVISLSSSNVNNNANPLLLTQINCGIGVEYSTSSGKRSNTSTRANSRSFEVITEKGGKKLMSEDEVNSLAHSAIRRARNTPAKPITSLNSNRGESGSTFSFDDFHTPTHSTCDADDEEGQQVGACSIQVKFSMDDGMKNHQDEEDNSCDRCNSVSSSNDIIRRVEEEITNARKAAQEATRRLAGVSANFMTTTSGTPKNSNRSSSNIGKKNDTPDDNDNNRKKISGKRRGDKVVNTSKESREPPPSHLSQEKKILNLANSQPSKEELHSLMEDDYSKGRNRTIMIDDEKQKVGGNSSETECKNKRDVDETNNNKNNDLVNNGSENSKENFDIELNGVSSGKVTSVSSMVDHVKDGLVLSENTVLIIGSNAQRIIAQEFVETANDSESAETVEHCAALSYEPDISKVLVASSALDVVSDYVPTDALKGLLSAGLDQNEDTEEELSRDARTIIKIQTSINALQLDELETVLSDDDLNQGKKNNNTGSFEKTAVCNRSRGSLKNVEDNCEGEDDKNSRETSIASKNCRNQEKKYKTTQEQEPLDGSYILNSETIPVNGADESIEVLVEPTMFKSHDDEINNTSQSDDNEVIEVIDSTETDKHHNANEFMIGESDDGRFTLANVHLSDDNQADTKIYEAQVIKDFVKHRKIEDETGHRIDNNCQRPNKGGATAALISNEVIDAFPEDAKEANARESKFEGDQSVGGKSGVNVEIEKETSHDSFCSSSQLQDNEHGADITNSRKLDKGATSDDDSDDQATEVMNNTRQRGTAKILRSVLGEGKNIYKNSDLYVASHQNNPQPCVPPTCSDIKEAPTLPFRNYEHGNRSKLNGKSPSVLIAREYKRSIEHGNDSDTRSTKVRFKQRYPVPQQMKKYRHPSEIDYDNKLDKPDDILHYSKPKKDLKDLLDVANGESIPRRSNACGALKVLSTQKKHRVTLVRTQGFLDALVFAIKDDYTNKDVESAIAVKTRAVSVVLNVSIKNNRYHVLSHPGVADCLVKCMIENKGEPRELACATLATIAKTQHCREIMANTSKLVDVLAIILKGDEPSSSFDDNNSSTYVDEEKINYSGDDEMSRVISESYSSSSSSTSSFSRQNSVDSQEEQQTIMRTRMNACAALSHLSKECSVSRKLCASDTLLFCLVSVTKEVTNPIHTKCLEILANLTRHVYNNTTLVGYPGLIDTLISNGSTKCDTDRLWCMRILQNLSSEPCAKSMLASTSVLELLSANMMRQQYDEQIAATATIYNISTEPGAVVPLTNTRNVVATLVHVAHSPSSDWQVRLIACDALATLGLWLQTLAGAGTVPVGVKAAPLPTYNTSGWQRWDK